MGGLGAQEFFAQDVQSGQGLYLTPEMSGEGERSVKLVMAMLDHLTRHPSSAAYTITFGLVVISRSAHADSW